MTHGSDLPAAPSGRQWTIRHGDEEAVVVEVGAGLRRYTKGGLDVVAGYRLDERAVAGRGQQLMPWPNRLRDGRYVFDGTELQLALSEPETHNAIHGLVRWTTWTLAEQSEQSVTLTHRLHPQPGWSWVLDLTLRYLLDDDGLTVTATARNVGVGHAPYGYAAHPYLSVRDADAAEVELALPASRYLEVDPDRLLPVATYDVAGTAYDFRGGRQVGGAALDTAFTDLERGPDGRWEVSLRGLDDAGPRGATLWGDAAYPWLQVYTGRIDATTEGSNGIAVEPMTCPPDAFNSGEDLLVIETGQAHTGTWGIRPA